MAKRKSITGVKKRRPKPALQKTPISRPKLARNASPESTELETAPKPRTLLSTRPIASQKPLPRRAKQPTLKPIVKHISQSTIRSRWTYLDEDAQAKVASILRSVELPVLARYASEQKKIEAQLTIGSVTGTLTKRIPKMPFPPKTKEMHFDYEALVKSNRTIQQRLTASSNVIIKLKDELREQKLALATETQELEGLEGSV